MVLRTVKAFEDCHHVQDFNTNEEGGGGGGAEYYQYHPLISKLHNSLSFIKEELYIIWKRAKGQGNRCSLTPSKE